MQKFFASALLLGATTALSLRMSAQEPSNINLAQLAENGNDHSQQKEVSTKESEINLAQLNEDGDADPKEVHLKESNINFAQRGTYGGGRFQLSEAQSPTYNSLSHFLSEVEQYTLQCHDTFHRIQDTPDVASILADGVQWTDPSYPEAVAQYKASY